jgi:GT2 family glycosyltransferase
MAQTGHDVAPAPLGRTEPDAPPLPDIRSQPAVSVVVPAYNRAGFLPQCLGALFAQTYPRERYEILLVDDGSTDGTAETARALAAAWGGALRVIQKPNGGPASARNAGIQASQAEVVAFIDSDCVADPDWLEGVVGALAAGDAAGAGGPIANLAPQGWVPRFLDASAFYRHRVRGGRVDYLLTGNAAFRRVALVAICGFVECAGAWGEDADLSFRLRRAGYLLVVSPRGSVTHHGSPATVSDLARELFRYGYGNGVLSREWANGRTPAVELTRHVGAVALAPLLVARLARRAGWSAAFGYWPLIVVEHSAFAAGILSGVARRGAWGQLGDGGHWRAKLRRQALWLRNGLRNRLRR